MEYQRVIPRDLFNDAKLLKCMGMLCLNILDNKMPSEKVGMVAELKDDFFHIDLLEEGNLCISNIIITINNKVINFHTTYNSKSPHPFYAYHEYVEYPVFDDAGEYEKEFIEFCESL